MFFPLHFSLQFFKEGSNTHGESCAGNDVRVEQELRRDVGKLVVKFRKNPDRNSRESEDEAKHDEERSRSLQRSEAAVQGIHAAALTALGHGEDRTSVESGGERRIHCKKWGVKMTPVGVNRGLNPRVKITP